MTFQNKRDFDGDQDIATNYPRDTIVIIQMPYAWGFKSYAF